MGKYRNKPKEIDAIQLVAEVGTSGVKAGDWLIIDGNNQYFMTDEDFKKLYEEVPAIDLSKLNQHVIGTPNTISTKPHWSSGPVNHTVRLNNPAERAGLPGDYNPREGMM